MATKYKLFSYKEFTILVLISAQPNPIEAYGIHSKITKHDFALLNF